MRAISDRDTLACRISRGRVLIIDDDDATRAMLADVFEAEGYETVAVSDGAAGLAHIECDCFDLVLLDLRMPGLDGTGFAREYQQLPPSRPPLVLLSGRPEAEILRAAAACGAAAALRKPFDLDDLLGTVQRHVTHVCCN